MPRWYPNNKIRNRLTHDEIDVHTEIFIWSSRLLSVMGDHHAVCLSLYSDFHKTWYKCCDTGGKSNNITISYDQQ